MKKRRELFKNLGKRTIPAHIFVGLLAAAIVLWCWPLSAVILTLFAFDEWWDDYCQGTKEGEEDWWWAFASFIVGTTFICVLHYL